jgi:hypothetical protein
MSSDESGGDGGGSEGDTGTEDSREQGIDIGPLADKLEQHSYPTTTEQIVREFGDEEIEMSDATRTVREVLGDRQDEDEEYESADDVRQMIYNMVGAEAVGRDHYSDRGGIAGEGDGDEMDAEDESF